MVIMYFLRVQRPEIGGDQPLLSSVALRMGLGYSYASSLCGISMTLGDLIPVESVVCYDSISYHIQNFGGITFKDILININLIGFPLTSKSHF